MAFLSPISDRRFNQVIWRPMREDDLTQCLQIAGPRGGLDLVGTGKGRDIWARLLLSPSFNGAVIESDVAISGCKVVGFGSSVFVSPAFADEELARPRPGLNSRILKSFERNEAVVLSETELKYLNTHSFLDLVVLCGCWNQSLLHPEQAAEIQTLLAVSFLEQHLGYRLRTLISEAIGEADRKFAEDSRMWKVHCEFPANSYQGASSGLCRALVVISRSEGSSVPGTVPAILFHSPAPTLGLRSADKRLLLAGNRGLTDVELAHELGLSISAVKKQWLSIFERIRMKCPDVFLGIHDEPNSETRGGQKRHRVLNYVRRHPEELRPTEEAVTKAVRVRQGPSRKLADAGCVGKDN